MFEKEAIGSNRKAESREGRMVEEEDERRKEEEEAWEKSDSKSGGRPAEFIRQASARVRRQLEVSEK